MAKTEGELIPLETSAFRGMNTGRARLYFSIKKRKFIKAFCRKKTAEYIYSYRLYPGYYLGLGWFYWNKREPPHKVIACFLKIKGKHDIDSTCAEWRVTENFHFENKILQDFFDARPTYHSGVSRSLFDKVYSEEEVQDLINKAKKRLLFIEGEENE